MSTLEWSPTEKFQISGYELETMITILSKRLSTPEAQDTIREYETLKRLQESIQSGITDGKVKVNDDSDIIV